MCSCTHTERQTNAQASQAFSDVLNSAHSCKTSRLQVLKRQIVSRYSDTVSKLQKSQDSLSQKNWPQFYIACVTYSICCTVQPWSWLGLSGPFFKWFQSFLSNLRYVVRLGEFVASTASLPRGLPQGYILAPTSLTSCHQNLLLIPHSKLKRRGERAFSVIEPRFWNDLPVEIRIDPSLPKSYLKICLFSLAC